MDHKNRSVTASEEGVGHKSGCKYIYTHKVNNSYKQKTYLTHFIFLC
jgi:hypothetical protein